MDNFLYAFLISTIAGLSTMLGCLFIFIKVKNINRFLSVALSFSASVMLLISIFDLIPHSFFSLVLSYKTTGILIAVISFIVGVLLINISNKYIKMQEEKGSSLYKLGIISAIVLILHNLPEGIITFLTSGNDLSLGIKIALAITLHNIPEGICIAVPIYYSTGKIGKAIKTTLISGLSEPLGAILAYLFLYKYITTDILNIIFICVAGIMISLSINEILKESFKYCEKNNKYIYIGFLIGILFFLLTIFI
ncbi:MAG: ZIP family metal transporter [Bacilli bacterium]|nr:ZIP family metal transporter [Bacilli bacterium]